MLSFSPSVVSDSLRPHGLQHTRLPCPSPTPGICSNSGPLSWWGDAIQPSHPLSSPSPPAISLAEHQGLSEWALHMKWSKYWSFSISICLSNKYSGLISFRMDSFDLEVKGDLKNFSPIPQFKTINSSALSLVYGPTLTSIHDYWKNHSFN